MKTAEPSITIPDVFGVKANIAEPRSAMRTGALCWISFTNPGWGGERVAVYARSRSGRMIETWIATKRLTNLRAGWIPLHLRHCQIAEWPTKAEAETWAKSKQALWCDPPNTPKD